MELAVLAAQSAIALIKANAAHCANRSEEGARLEVSMSLANGKSDAAGGNS